MSSAVSAAPASVLTFGCADATAGGGIQSDVLTIASMGCHPLSVVCAVAVRDTRGLEELLALDADTVVAQARAILEDIPVQAFRVGMVGSVENIAAIAEVLSDYPELPLVLEPALFHLDGNEELSEDFAGALVELLLPMSTVLVLGPHDVERMLVAFDEGGDADDGLHDEDEDAPIRPGPDIARDVQRLIGFGAAHVLLTGAGEPGPTVVNMLFGSGGRIRSDAWERLGGHYLGARATLASAVAAALAHGMDMPEACREAQEFVWQALSSGYRIGMGLAVPDRLFWAREADPDEH